MSDNEHRDDAVKSASAGDKRASIAESLDEETDAFEDVAEVAEAAVAQRIQTSSPVESTRSSARSSTRSLTDRRSSTMSIAQDTQDKRANTPPIPAVPEVEASSDVDHKESELKPQKSPLLTARRLSHASLDNISLEDISPSQSVVLSKDPETSAPQPVASKPIKSPVTGLSGKLPQIPWSPPPLHPPTTNLAAPTAPTRKLTSPFSWLSRNASVPKETVTSPPLSSPNSAEQRRSTVSSVLTVASNPEMMLSKLEEGSEDGNGQGPVKNNLKDRFKLLRMREEAGIISLPEDDKTGSSIAGLIRQGTNLGLGLVSPTSVGDDREGPLSPVPKSPNPSIINPALAPGTAAGVSAGPTSDSEGLVDWDLWQSVVYEGPAAVARTSPEELNRAIATGIPSAIRGVVWQVLAQSKNEELEVVYKNLITRGTDKEKDRMSASSVGGSTKDKDAIRSSASSVSSDQSAPPATLINGPRSPTPPSEKDIEAMAKAQATALVERKRRAKEDAASLQKLEKAIKRDLGARTSFSKFAVSAGLQDGLFGVCKSYALFDEGVGYAQGMNFLAMPLLFNMPEEEAFCLLVRLMNHYHLRDLFIQDMPGLHKHLYLFERLLEDFEPALYCHLYRRQVSPHLYATQWFLTLFAYRFPLQLVLRIYDLILSEGLSAILKFGIVLMQKNAATLLAMNDMVALTTFLKDRLFDVYIDSSPSAGSILESGFFGSSGASIDKEVYRADHLVQDACAVKVTPELLKAYTVEWEEKTALERAREHELENLKSSNASLTVKVRRLEERVESHDQEHASLATELVRTKVENEELKEENETLKVTVEELKHVVDKQPEEVEERLKSEMDRLMKRNQEVHEENGRLEEDMAEMEKTLVETKMAHAEISSQHEALNRKWIDLRKALG